MSGRLFLRLGGLGNYRFANRLGVDGCKNDICPWPHLGIVDDIIPGASRGVGATHRSPRRVSCLLSSTIAIIALPKGNGVHIDIWAKRFCNADFKSTYNSAYGCGDDFLIFIFPSIPFGDRGFKSGHDGTDGLGAGLGLFVETHGCRGDRRVAPTGRVLSLVLRKISYPAT